MNEHISSFLNSIIYDFHEYEINLYCISLFYYDSNKLSVSKENKYARIN